MRRCAFSGSRGLSQHARPARRHPMYGVTRYCSGSIIRSMALVAVGHPYATQRRAARRAMRTEAHGNCCRTESCWHLGTERPFPCHEELVLLGELEEATSGYAEAVETLMRPGWNLSTFADAFCHTGESRRACEAARKALRAHRDEHGRRRSRMAAVTRGCPSDF
jgi:hypothetical protein